MARRVPTAVIVPADVQELPYAPPGHEHRMVPGGLGYQAPVVVPADEDLRRAAEVLNAGSRVAMLIVKAPVARPTRSLPSPSVWARESPKPSSAKTSSGTMSRS